MRGQSRQQALFVLDKSNDVYRMDLATETWTVEQATVPVRVEPDPHYIALAHYAGRLYLLDTARDNIWRHPADAARPSNYFPITPKPWDLVPGWPDVTHGIDLAVDGDVYVLTWDGAIKKFTPAEQADFTVRSGRLSGSSTTEAATTNVQPKPKWPYLVPSQGPLALATTALISELYVLDPDARQVFVIDKATGSRRRTLRLQFPAGVGPASALATSQVDDPTASPVLYLAAGDELYVYLGNPAGEQGGREAGRQGSNGSVTPPPRLPARPGPNDPRVLDLLASSDFQLPLAGVLLGNRTGVYPGARRAYRYGVHEGHDFYNDEKNHITVTLGMPVLAAQAGQVIRADLNYRELTPAEYEAVIEASRRAHSTSPENENLIRGRQVEIDHGNGIVTRYAHLNSIADGIKPGVQVAKGQVIGSVGLSGTSDGIYHRGSQFAHLHFEIWIGDHYLGQWLSVPETMRITESVPE